MAGDKSLECFVYLFNFIQTRTSRWQYPTTWVLQRDRAWPSDMSPNDIYLILFESKILPQSLCRIGGLKGCHSHCSSVWCVRVVTLPTASRMAVSVTTNSSNVDASFEMHLQNTQMVNPDRSRALHYMIGTELPLCHIFWLSYPYVKALVVRKGWRPLHYESACL